MSIAQRRAFLEAANAYTRANAPTAQLTLDFIAAFAQMLATDCGGQVSVVLPEGVVITHDPAQPPQDATK